MNIKWKNRWQKCVQNLKYKQEEMITIKIYKYFTEKMRATLKTYLRPPSLAVSQGDEVYVTIRKYK